MASSQSGLDQTPKTVLVFDDEQKPADGIHAQKHAITIVLTLSRKLLPLILAVPTTYGLLKHVAAEDTLSAFKCINVIPERAENCLDRDGRGRTSILDFKLQAIRLALQTESKLMAISIAPREYRNNTSSSNIRT